MRRIAIRFLSSGGQIKHRILASSCCLICGRALFENEVLEKNSLLLERFKAEPHQRNDVLQCMWKSLTIERRKAFNAKARVLSVFDCYPKKKEYPLSTEDLVLKRLREDYRMRNYLSSSGCSGSEKEASEMFLSGMARVAASHLPSRHKSALEKLSIAENRNVLRRFLEPQKARERWTNMLFYQSFTDMLRTLAPTPKILYFELCALFSRTDFSPRFLCCVANRYNALPEEDKTLFRPIESKEKLRFERFCCLHCGGMSKECIDIISLFAAFRGLQPIIRGINPIYSRIKKGDAEGKEAMKEMDSVYKGFLSCDSIHDGDFFRARRALSKLKSLRSSECGKYLYRRQQLEWGHSGVPTDAYRLRCARDLDEVAVAEMLVSTRHGSSVYDEVLDRANVLRTKTHAQHLSVYRVKEVVIGRIRKSNIARTQKKMDSKRHPGLTQTIEKFFSRSQRSTERRDHLAAGNRKTLPVLPSRFSSFSSLNKPGSYLAWTKQQTINKMATPQPIFRIRNEELLKLKEKNRSSEFSSIPRSLSKPIIKMLPQRQGREDVKRIAHPSPSSVRMWFRTSGSFPDLNKGKIAINQ